MTDNEGAAAAIYARISNDPEELERGVERQQQDCRELASAAGAARSHALATRS